MALAVVQAARITELGGKFASQTTRTGTFSSNVTATNSIVVISASNVPAVRVTDGLGNSYQLKLTFNSVGCYVQIFLAQNILGGACTYTITYDPNVNWAATANAIEVDANLEFDESAKFAQTAFSTGPFPGTVHTTRPDAFAVVLFSGGWILSGGPTITTSPTPGWLNNGAKTDGSDTVGPGTGRCLAECMYQVYTAVQSGYRPAWVISTTRRWASAFASFYEVPTPPSAIGAVVHKRMPRIARPGSPFWMIAHRPRRRNYGPPPDDPPAPIVGQPWLLQRVKRNESVLGRIDRFTRNTALMLNSLAQQRFITNVSAGVFALRSGGFASQRDPTYNDDSRIGASTGCIWVNTTDERVWVCKDATVDLASWLEFDTTPDDDPDRYETGFFPIPTTSQGRYFINGLLLERGKVLKGGVFADTVDASDMWSTLTPAVLTADQNDYAPGLTTPATLLRVATDGSGGKTITGFAQGTACRILVVRNYSAADSIGLDHESGSSSAANRILTPGGLSSPIAAGSATQLIYDITSERWQIIS